MARSLSIRSSVKRSRNIIAPKAMEVMTAKAAMPSSTINLVRSLRRLNMIIVIHQEIENDGLDGRYSATEIKIRLMDAPKPTGRIQRFQMTAAAVEKAGVAWRRGLFMLCAHRERLPTSEVEHYRTAKSQTRSLRLALGGSVYSASTAPCSHRTVSASGPIPAFGALTLEPDRRRSNLSGSKTLCLRGQFKSEVGSISDYRTLGEPARQIRSSRTNPAVPSV